MAAPAPVAAQAALKPPKARGPRPVDPVSPTMLCAWLYLRDAGGWYTLFEVAEEVIAPMLPPGTPAQRVNNLAGKALWALMRRGHVAQKVFSRSRMAQFGVTAKCTPPEGESLQPRDRAVRVDGVGLIHD